MSFLNQALLNELTVRETELLVQRAHREYDGELTLTINEADELIRTIVDMRQQVEAIEVMYRVEQATVDRLVRDAQQPTKLRPIEEWHEDFGAVLWWHVPIQEPPHCGSPLGSDWPEGEDEELGSLLPVGYYTHWCPLPKVIEPYGPVRQETE